MHQHLEPFSVGARPTMLYRPELSSVSKRPAET